MSAIEHQNDESKLYQRMERKVPYADIQNSINPADRAPCPSRGALPTPPSRPSFQQSDIPQASALAAMQYAATEAPAIHEALPTLLHRRLAKMTKANPSSGTTIPQSRADFDRLSWCAALLNAPGTVTFQPQPDRKAISRPGNRFFGQALNSPERVPAYVSFHAAFPDSASRTERTVGTQGADGVVGREPLRECSTLWALGDALDGFPGVAHGGLVCALLDETMGILIDRNLELGRDLGFRVGAGVATARMDVRFQRPVRIPGVILGMAWIYETKGRGMKMRAELRDYEGTLLASCLGGWVGIERANL